MYQKLVVYGEHTIIYDNNDKDYYYNKQKKGVKDHKKCVLVTSSFFGKKGRKVDKSKYHWHFRQW